MALVQYRTLHDAKQATHDLPDMPGFLPGVYFRYGSHQGRRGESTLVLEDREGNALVYPMLPPGVQAHLVRVWRSVGVKFDPRPFPE